MANTNKLKFTAWTNSGMRVEMSTGPLEGSARHLIDLLTPVQLDNLRAYADARAKKLHAVAVSKGAV